LSSLPAPEDGRRHRLRRQGGQQGVCAGHR